MTIALGDMRSMCQRRIADTAATSFYSSTLMNDFINGRVRTRSGMIERFNPNYYLEQSTITGVDDADDSSYEFYSVPSNFRHFVSLSRIFGTGTGRLYQPLRCVNAENQERYMLSSRTQLALPDTITNYEQVVSIWKTQIRIIPAPSSNSYSYRFKYLRKPANAVGDSTNLDIPDEWQELIALDVSIFALSTIGENEALVKQLNMLRLEELKNMKDEYRRRSMGFDSIPTLDTM